MRKLEIGDKLYNLSSERWGDRHFYKFAEVVRLTKTQAVLSDDTKLINEPHKKFIGEGFEYREFGNRWIGWEFSTEEIENTDKRIRETYKKENWFSTKNFTREEKVIIYDKFKELNIL